MPPLERLRRDAVEPGERTGQSRARDVGVERDPRPVADPSIA
jgi:hypothetical protein